MKQQTQIHILIKWDSQPRPFGAGVREPLHHRSVSNLTNCSWNIFQQQFTRFENSKSRRFYYNNTVAIFLRRLNTMQTGKQFNKAANHLTKTRTQFKITVNHEPG